MHSYVASTFRSSPRHDVLSKIVRATLKQNELDEYEFRKFDRDSSDDLHPDPSIPYPASLAPFGPAGRLENWNEDECLRDIVANMCDEVKRVVPSEHLDKIR